jgi:hypothetical protein
VTESRQVAGDAAAGDAVTDQDSTLLRPHSAAASPIWSYQKSWTVGHISTCMEY